MNAMAESRLFWDWACQLPAPGHSARKARMGSSFAARLAGR